MATRFLPLFFTNVLLATCYPFARYLKGFRIFLPVPVRGAVTIFVALYRTESMVSRCLFQAARLFMHFWTFLKKHMSKRPKTISDQVLLPKTILQIFSQICIDYSGADFYQAKKFRARPDADPQPCPLEQVHILGKGKKIGCKLEEREKQYGVLTSQIIIPLTIISTCRSPGISVGDPWHFVADPGPQSVPLTNGSGSGSNSGSESFLHWFCRH